MIWKNFPYYWLFVGRITNDQWIPLTKLSFDISFVVSMIKLLNKQLSSHFICYDAHVMSLLCILYLINGFSLYRTSYSTNNDVKRALRQLKSLATWLFLQQFVDWHQRLYQSSTLQVLCEGKPPEWWIPFTNGQWCRFPCHDDIIKALKRSNFHGIPISESCPDMNYKNLVKYSLDLLSQL